MNLLETFAEIGIFTWLTVSVAVVVVIAAKTHGWRLRRERKQKGVLGSGKPLHILDPSERERRFR